LQLAHVYRARIRLLNYFVLSNKNNDVYYCIAQSLRIILLILIHYQFNYLLNRFGGESVITCSFSLWLPVGIEWTRSIHK